MKSLPISAFALLLIISGLIACGGETTPKENATTEETAGKFSAEEMQAQQQAWDKVMTVHDEVMPKMGTMNQLTKSLKAQWEDNKKLDAVTKDDISGAVQELESADEGMWDWMHQLKQLQPLQASESSHDAIIKYIQEQEQSIILIREEMANSMAKADSLLKALND